MTEPILDYTFGPTLKTGQTNDLTPSGKTTKADGGFQRGINKTKESTQYVVLTTGQYSGTTNITINGKTDIHSNECIYDKATNIMWSRNLSASVFGAGTEDLAWDDGVNREDIFAYCDEANLAELSGYNDWRIANTEELFSLIVYDNSLRPDSTAFPVWTTLQIWTCTTFAFSDNLWGMVQINGDRARILKAGSRRRVLLCRAGV